MNDPGTYKEANIVPLPFWLQVCITKCYDAYEKYLAILLQLRKILHPLSRLIEKLCVGLQCSLQRVNVRNQGSTTCPFVHCNVLYTNAHMAAARSQQ